MKNVIAFEELDTKELKEIDGGKNLIEYIAYGIGYASRELYDAAVRLSDVPRPYGMY